MTSAPACPGCGGPLVIPATGRRPVWCSTACRQRAHKARAAADRYAADAAWARGQAADAVAATARLAGQLAEAWQQVPAPGPPGEHGQAVADAPGWETAIAAVAAELEHAAHGAEIMAIQHARSAAACRTARATAGLRRPEASTSSSDETPAGSVVWDQLAAAATKAVTPDDPDVLFDAVEDVLARAHSSTAAGSALPDVLAEAIDDLGDEFASTSGAGPFGALIAAAGLVVDAARLPWEGADLARVTALAGVWDTLAAALPAGQA